MKNNKLISIAMCTYNGEKYIHEQIESILKQTVSNIELIIVDDGSTDNTIQIINDYYKLDNRIKLFINERNLGYIKNFERAISLTKGDYIVLSDQDDIWNLNKLEILKIELENSDVDLVYANSTFIDENKNILNKKLFDFAPNYFGNDNLKVIFNNPITGHSMMFKNEAIQISIPFPDKIFHDLWITFVFSTLFKIKRVEQSLVNYRIHQNNVTNIGRKKVKKSYLDKIHKKRNSIDNLVNKLYYFEDFLKRNNLNNNLEIISELLKEYKKFEVYFFNIKLFKVIYLNKDLLFPNKKISIFKILKMSLGIKIYKIMPFI